MTFKIVNGMEVKPSDLKTFLDRHDSYKWVYARTMPFAPHSYVWKGREIPDDEYDLAFGAIRTFGETGKYWDRTQIYLHNRERGIRYWLMDRHHYTCLIINMATDGKDYGVQDAPSTFNEHWAEYDAISPWWDDIYREFDDFDSGTLWKLVHQNAQLVKPTLLDIGAGTGATLDAKVAPSQHTTAVDPSQGMLNDLVVKYPQIGRVHSMTFAELLSQQKGIKKYDLVTASTGSGSYLTPEEIRAAFDSTKQLLVLSFYNSIPTHRKDMPDTHSDALTTAIELPGAVSMTHGNFLHVVTRGA